MTPENVAISVIVIVATAVIGAFVRLLFNRIPEDIVTKVNLSSQEPIVELRIKQEVQQRALDEIKKGLKEVQEGQNEARLEMTEHFAQVFTLLKK